ncbi:MAG: thiamine pyrophosphate-binding protein [Actinomycetia bacterium]|nr:thiamine pyrophosphate-binding protein [Actinomycetes bacterium]
MAHMTGGEAVARTLEALGVTKVFGIVSVHNLPVYDALTRVVGIEVIRARHEQAAVHAADGFARATGRLGVALTSTGPGAANAVPGLYEARFGSSPVLMITGQTESSVYGKGKGFVHEHETQVEMLGSVVRRVESVRRPADIPTIVDLVGRDCLTGRPSSGAVEIPIDYQYLEMDHEIPGPRPIDRRQSDIELIEQAAELLSGAERPLIWAGGGVVSADASPQLIALAEKLDAPVITTLEGRGAIPETHRLALGPRTERPAMTPIIEEADVVLAVGTRFQNYSTRVWRLPIPGRIIHLDADPHMIGLNYRAEVGIVGDAQLGLAALGEAVTGGNTDSGYLDRAAKSVEADLERSREEIGPDHQAICGIIRRLLPDDAVIVRDSTVPNYLWGNRTLPILAPRTSMRPSSSSIGPGIGLAFGAAVGSRARTFLMVGDGGFQLLIGELASIAEYQLPIVICVFNDGGYGVLRIIQDAVLEARTGVDLHTPDFAAVARGMGLDAASVDSVDSFEAVFAEAVERPGPTLIDVAMGGLAPMSFRLPPHQRRP